MEFIVKFLNKTADQAARRSKVDNKHKSSQVARQSEKDDKHKSKASEKGQVLLNCLVSKEVKQLEAYMKTLNTDDEYDLCNLLGLNNGRGTLPSTLPPLPPHP